MLSAIGMHTGTMTVAESERMFREHAYQDPGTLVNRLRAARLIPDMELHHRQAADSKATAGLDSHPRRGEQHVERVPRRVPEVRSTTDTARAEGDARRECGLAVLTQGLVRSSHDNLADLDHRRLIRDVSHDLLRVHEAGSSGGGRGWQERRLAPMSIAPWFGDLRSNANMS